MVSLCDVVSFVLAVGLGVLYVHLHERFEFRWCGVAAFGVNGTWILGAARAAHVAV